MSTNWDVTHAACYHWRRVSYWNLAVSVKICSACVHRVWMWCEQRIFGFWPLAVLTNDETFVISSTSSHSFPFLTQVWKQKTEKSRPSCWFCEKGILRRNYYSLFKVCDSLSFCFQDFLIYLLDFQVSVQSAGSEMFSGRKERENVCSKLMWRLFIGYTHTTGERASNVCSFSQMLFFWPKKLEGNIFN